MVAGFLLHPKRQFYRSANNRYSFTFIAKIQGDTTENASRITLHRTDIHRN